MPVVLVGKAFWSQLIDFELMVDEGTIEQTDLDLFTVVDTPEEAWQAICQCYDLKNGKAI